MRILLVEAETSLTALLQKRLTQSDYAVTGGKPVG